MAPYAVRVFAAAASAGDDGDGCSRAAQMLLQGNAAEAVALLRQVETDLALFGLAAALPPGDSAGAKAAAERGLARRGEEATSQELLIAASAHLAAGDSATASSLAARAVAMREEPDGEDLWLAATAALQQGDAPHAAALFDRALPIRTAGGTCICTLSGEEAWKAARAMRRAKQAHTAKACVESAIALSPRPVPRQHLFLAALELDMRHFQSARRAMERAIELLGTRTTSAECLLLGRACLGAHDEEAALAAYARGMELSVAEAVAPPKAENQAFAVLVLQQGEQAQHLATPAREAMQRVITETPAGTTGSLKVMLASLQTREGDMAGAEASYGEAITELEAEGKFTGTARIMHGRLLHKLGRNEEALLAMERGCEETARHDRPVSSDVRAELAQLRSADGPVRESS